MIPELPLVEDVPYYLVLRPFPRLLRGEKCVKVKYRAGYDTGEVPPDLAAACLELAAWNMTRYRGRRFGGEQGIGKMDCRRMCGGFWNHIGGRLFNEE
jgi:hypothetical protein